MKNKLEQFWFQFYTLMKWGIQLWVWFFKRNWISGSENQTQLQSSSRQPTHELEVN
jgi:hypothetical protein